MRTDQEIYNDIGSILLSIAPDDAKNIILCAKLEPESDSGEFTYDYIDNHGGQHWLTETRDASEKLLDLLVELRGVLVDAFKSQEKSFWHSCEISINIDDLKINITFGYND